MVKKYHIVAIVVLVALAVAQWLGILVGIWTLSDVLSVIPYFIFTAMFGVFLWGLGKGIQTALGKRPEPELTKSISMPYKPDMRFSYLAIHYLRVKGYQEDPDSSRLKCLTHEKSRTAFWKIPEWLEEPIKEHNIIWIPYDDERVLKKYIKDHYAIIETPLTYEGLGLQIREESIELQSDKYAYLVEKLKDRKLESLQVAYLTRWHPSARRTLLIDFSEKKVWLSPLCDSDLLANGIITSETYGMWPFESCSWWVRRKFLFHFHFVPQRYPESKLLAKGA